MSKFSRFLLSFGLLFLTVNTTFAASTKIYKEPDLAPSNNNWRFTITPYLWAMNMNGRVKMRGLGAHVNQSFSDILSHLNGAGMLYVDAHKGPFGLFFNGLYAVLSQNGSFNILRSHVLNQFGIFSGGVSYIVYQRPFWSESHLQFEPYAGARYTSNHVTLQLTDIFNTINLRGASKHSWTDPIIGMRGRWDFNHHWSAVLAGDIGGTNANTQKSYNIMGFFGYKPGANSLFRNTTTYLGYRLLYQHYQTGGGTNLYEWNMHIFGPVLGLAFEL